MYVCIYTWYPPDTYLFLYVHHMVGSKGGYLTYMPILRTLWRVGILMICVYIHSRLIGIVVYLGSILCKVIQLNFNKIAFCET